jgi:hypothetical protein
MVSFCSRLAFLPSRLHFWVFVLVAVFLSTDTSLWPQYLLAPWSFRMCGFLALVPQAAGVTKPNEFIGVGVKHVTKHYEFIGFGAMDVTEPYEFIGFGAGAPQNEAEVLKAAAPQGWRPVWDKRDTDTLVWRAPCTFC